MILLCLLEFIFLCFVNESFNYFYKVFFSVVGVEILSEVSVFLGENVELVCNVNGIFILFI